MADVVEIGAPTTKTAFSSFTKSDVPSEVTTYILTYLFAAAIQPYLTTSALWFRTRGRPARFTVSLTRFYRLRFVNRYWNHIITCHPVFWTFFPLERFTYDEFRLHKGRSVRQGNQGPKIVVFAGDDISLSFFTLLLSEGHGARMEFLHLWLEQSAWITLKSLFLAHQFPLLSTAFMALRRTRRDNSWHHADFDPWADGWAAVTPDDNHQWTIDNRWNKRATEEYRVLRSTNRASVQHRYITEILPAVFPTMPALAKLLLGRSDFITYPFRSTQSLSVLHIRGTLEPEYPIVFQLGQFVDLITSLPVLRELDIWKVGFDVTTVPNAFPPNALRHLALCCSHASIAALSSCFRHLRLDTFVLEICPEGMVDASTLNAGMVDIMTVFTSAHVVSSVGLQATSTSTAWGRSTYELYLRSLDGNKMTVRIHPMFGHVLHDVISTAIASDITLSLCLSDSMQHVKLNEDLVHRYIPWGRVDRLHLVDLEAGTPIVMDYIREVLPSPPAYGVVLHEDRNSSWNWKGYGGFGDVPLFVQYTATPPLPVTCCKWLLAARSEWVKMDGESVFSPLLVGIPLHLQSMMVYNEW